MHFPSILWNKTTPISRYSVHAVLFIRPDLDHAHLIRRSVAALGPLQSSLASPARLALASLASCARQWRRRECRLSHQRLVNIEPSHMLLGKSPRNNAIGGGMGTRYHGPTRLLTCPHTERLAVEAGLGMSTETNKCLANQGVLKARRLQILRQQTVLLVDICREAYLAKSCQNWQMLGD